MDSHDITLVLHGEQLSVHDHSISVLEDQVNVLENTDVVMEERLDSLEITNQDTEDRLNELETIVNDTNVQDDLIDRVTQLEMSTGSQQNDIDGLNARVGVHDGEINALEDVDSGFEQRIAQLEEGGSSGGNVSRIGFNARLTSYDVGPANTPILYDDVIENVGEGYSPETGLFTAEIAGLYYFEQYWVKNYNLAGSMTMWKNGVEQCRSVGTHYSALAYIAPSCSATMQLSPGDEVWVTSSDGDRVHSGETTGFTGFLIKAYV